jgi:hypothetical protein
LAFASCDRDEIPLREDSEYANPTRHHVPGSDPGATPPGGSSAHSSDTMTSPPAAAAQPGTPPADGKDKPQEKKQE